MNDEAKHHLKWVATGAEITSRHARALAQVPPWKTAALDEMEDAEKQLAKALQQIRDARNEYDFKEIT